MNQTQEIENELSDLAARCQTTDPLFAAAILCVAACSAAPNKYRNLLLQSVANFALKLNDLIEKDIRG
jgi:hypothetical protein